MDQETASVLPPKNNHDKDRQPNGSSQRMAAPYETEASIDGVIKSSVKMFDQTANGELDVSQSRAAHGHAINALTGMKLKANIIGQLDKQKPEVLALLADVIGGNSGERFRAAIATQHSQRQIAADKQPDSQNNKPDQG